MKIKAESAQWFVNHCKGLEQLTGIAYGYEAYRKLKRLEDKLHRYSETACNRELTERETKEVSRLEASVSKLILPQWKDQLYFNGDPRGVVIKLRTHESENDRSKAVEGLHEVPTGLSKDWGGYVMVAPEF